MKKLINLIRDNFKIQKHSWRQPAPKKIWQLRVDRGFPFFPN